MCPVKPLLTLYTLSSKFVCFFALSPNTLARDVIVQSLGRCERKRNNSKTEKIPSDPEQLQLQSQSLRSQRRSLNLNMTTDSLLPNSGYTAQSPFHYSTQLEVQLWMVPQSWMTEPRAVLVLQFTDYHWILMSI